MKTNHTTILSQPSPDLARAESMLSAAGFTFTAVDRCPVADCSPCRASHWNSLSRAA